MERRDRAGSVDHGFGLSYCAYPQAKSFEDGLNAEISKQTRAIIASAEQLQKRHIKVSKSLHTTVFEGFERLTYDLQGIRQGLSGIDATLNWGFSETPTGVSQLNGSLQELVRIHKNTAQERDWERPQQFTGRCEPIPGRERFLKRGKVRAPTTRKQRRSHYCTQDERPIVAS